MTKTPHTSFMPECNPVAMQQRQDRLDALYMRDGRDSPEHENHSTYTGLWAKYVGEPYPAVAVYETDGAPTSS